MDNLKETYNKIAKDWHKDHQADGWWVDGTQKFVSFLKKGDVVLDVGCGGGFKSGFLVKKGLQVTGIDFSDKLLEIAKREVPEGTFLEMDMKDVDKLQQEFDGVFVQAALLHIPKQEVPEILKKLASKLKSGGYLYISVKEVWDDGPEEEVKEEEDYGYLYKRFFSYFTLNELREYFKDLNMKVVWEDLQPSGGTRWLQIIGQK